MIFLIILQLVIGGFLLSTASVPIQDKEIEYYVTPTPAPNPDCPLDKPCHTLNEYAQNSSSFFDNQTSIILLFMNGQHNLTSCKLLLSKLDSVNFTAAVSNFDILKPQVIIRINLKISLKNAAVVHIQNLKILSSRPYGKDALEIINAREFNCYQVVFFLGQRSVIYLQNVHAISLTQSHYTNGTVNYQNHWYDQNQNHTELQLRHVNFTVTNCTFSSSDIQISLDAEQASLNVTLHNCTSSPAGDFWPGDPWVYIETYGIETLVVLNIAHSNISYYVDGSVTIHVAEQTVIDICILDSVFNHNDIEVQTDIHSTVHFSIVGCQMLKSMIDISVKAYTKAWVTMKDSWIVHGSNSLGIGASISLERHAEAAIKIENCSISHCLNTGISLVLSEKSSFVISVQDSEIAHCLFGIYVSFTEDNWRLNLTISNSNISNNNLAGIELFPKAVRNVGNSLLLQIFESRISGNKYGVVVNPPTFHTNFSSVIIQNCTFAMNTDVSFGVFGSENLFRDRTDITMTNVLFINNSDTSENQAIVKISNNVEMTVANCTFYNNQATPIQAVLGSLRFEDDTAFVNNIGIRGGALSLVYSSIYISNNTDILFLNNTAKDVGGAIYVQYYYSLYTFTPLYSLCFYQLPDFSDRSSVINIDSTLNFTNNRAARGGQQVYGVALAKACLVSPTSETFSADMFLTSNLFYFHQQSGTALSKISSDPKRVCVCKTNSKPQCASASYIFLTETRYPGEKFNISMVVVGDEFGTVSAEVYTSILPALQEDPVSLGPHQSIQITDYRQCNDLLYSVHAHENSTVVLAFTATPNKVLKFGDPSQINSSIEDYNLDVVIPDELLSTAVFMNITLKKCPMGFEIVGHPPSCDCNTILKDIGINNCTIENHRGLVYRSGTQWVGTASVHNITTIVVTNYCPLDYCKPEILPVMVSDSDNQCANGRSGTLCGACRGNFSQIFGSSICQPCSDDNHLALIIAFAISGVALVFFIKLLDFTVAKGTINGLIFYSNIVWANKNIVLSTEYSSPVLNQILKTFLAWLNLDLGINTCFYVGLTAYWKTWLQYIFPIYVWMIAGLMILVSHFSIRASRVFGNNSIPVLATLFLLSYSKLLRTIITSLSFTYLQHSDGHLTVWTEDGTVTFFTLAHAILFTIALLCLAFVWAPFMLTLLFIQPLRKMAHVWPLRWINKWKPLFDAYTGPLKDKYHYWIGVLLFARGIVLVVSAVTSAVIPRLNLLAIAITSAVLGLHSNIYRRWYLSLLEKSFLLNLSALAIGLLYIDIVDEPLSRASIAYTSIGIAFLQFICITIVHVIYRLKNWRQQRNGCAQLERELDPPVRRHQGEDYREPLIESSGAH